MFDYETLRLIWWGLIAILVLGFLLTDGFDLGVGMLLTWLGRTDEERRVVLNVVGPTWEGNQVWLVTLGGATFGAWPMVYAAGFSGLYPLMFLLLFALFLRPAGFDYRSKVQHPNWRRAWDWALFFGGLIPGVVLSAGIGVLLEGIPFDIDNDFRLVGQTGFEPKLTHVLTAATGVAILVMHGAAYVLARTEGAVAARASVALRYAAPIFLGGFALTGLWLVFGNDGFRVTSAIDADAASNPLRKLVERSPSAWLDNYRMFPALVAAPAVTILAALLAWRGAASNAGWPVFLATGAALVGAIMTLAGSMFPFLLPSSTHPSVSLTVWDASASPHTLRWITVAAAILLPLICAYTAWVYRVLRGTVTVRQVIEHTHSMY